LGVVVGAHHFLAGGYMPDHYGGIGLSGAAWSFGSSDQDFQFVRAEKLAQLAFDMAIEVVRWQSFGHIKPSATRLPFA
jgi:hypothetical protein